MLSLSLHFLSSQYLEDGSSSSKFFSLGMFFFLKKNDEKQGIETSNLKSFKVSKISSLGKCKEIT